MTPDQNAPDFFRRRNRIAADGSSGGAAERKRFQIDPRFIAPIFITFILLIGQVFYGILKASTGRCSQSARASPLNWFWDACLPANGRTRRAPTSPVSASVFWCAPAFWPYALCGMIAIASKYVIRVNGRHIWNPRTSPSSSC